MNKWQKLGAGLGLIVAVLAIGIMFSPKIQALALADIQKATYKLSSQKVGQQPASIDMVVGGKTIQFADANPLDSIINYKAIDQSKTNFCDSTIVGAGTNFSNVRGISFGSGSFNGNGTVTAAVNLEYKDPGGKCQDYSSTITFSQGANGVVSGVDSGSGGNSAAGGSNAPTCESQNHSSFEWIFCPIVTNIDDTVNQLDSAIESLLIFHTTGANSDFGDKDQIQKAWGALKNIATVLFVIVALVMVISQAVSWGPFDPYTIRKILPRLIIAIIGIQLSFFILSWFIELANDTASGIASLLYAPFGGPDAVSFTTLSSRFVGASESTGIFGAMALVGTAAALKLNIFGVIALALPAIFAILVGFLVLIFRKILIILAVVLAPLAIVAWILPGTQKYWKLWHETFSSLLIMFPLIIGVIASGRIFAYIATTGSASPSAPILTSITNFALIVVGFFGPYLLLPKAFQWGGKALGAITGMTNNRSKGLVDRSRKFLGERQKQKDDRKVREANARLVQDRTTPRSGFGRIGRGLDLAKAGRLDPTRRMADRKLDLEHQKKGEELANEDATYQHAHEEEMRKLQIQRDTHGARHEATLRNLDAQELSEVEKLRAQTAEFDLSGIGRMDYDRGNIELESIATATIGSTRTFVNPDGTTRTGEVTAEHIAQAVDTMRGRNLIGQFEYTDPTTGVTTTGHHGVRDIINGLRTTNPNLAAKIINDHPGEMKAQAADLLGRQPHQLRAPEIATQDVSTLEGWAANAAVYSDRGNQAAMRTLRLSDEWQNLTIQKRQAVESMLARDVGGQMAAPDIVARATAGTLASDIADDFGGFGGLKPQELQHIIDTAAATPGVIPDDVLKAARVEQTSRRRSGAVV